MNSFKSYLSDYLVNKGRYYLPDKEDYSIKVLGNNEINDYFDKIDMSKFSLDQIRKSNTFGMTMFARNTKIFKQFNDKVGCIIIFIDRIINTSKNNDIIFNALHTLFHECRHIQQFDYILEKENFKIQPALELMYLETLENEDYNNRIIEMDANIYSLNRIFSRTIKDFPLSKVYNYLKDKSEKGD